MKDATAALIVVMFLFILPAKPDFVNIFNKDESKRPTVASPPLVTWKVVQTKLPWGLIFLLGGGFALAEGSKVSAWFKQLMTDMIAIFHVINVELYDLFPSHQHGPYQQYNCN